MEKVKRKNTSYSRFSPEKKKEILDKAKEKRANMTEEDKEKLRAYQRNYRKTEKYKSYYYNNERPRLERYFAKLAWRSVQRRTKIDPFISELVQSGLSISSEGCGEKGFTAQGDLRGIKVIYPTKIKYTKAERELINEWDKKLKE